jgi:alpha-glucosidase
MVANWLWVGVVWPGPTAFPDWFNDGTQGWWNNEFNIFFSPDNGVDIDGLWIDMNEASNFCRFPCQDPAGFASANNFPPNPPPVRSNPRPLPGFPSDFQPSSAKFKRQASVNGKMIGLSGRDLLNPLYSISNAAGVLSEYTIDTNLIHAGDGYVEYDTHNLYGTSERSKLNFVFIFN